MLGLSGVKGLRNQVQCRLSAITGFREFSLPMTGSKSAPTNLPLWTWNFSSVTKRPFLPECTMARYRNALLNSERDTAYMHLIKSPVYTFCSVFIQEQRVKIEREFTNWLKECHERFDKQVCVC